MVPREVPRAVLICPGFYRHHYRAEVEKGSNGNEQISGRFGLQASCQLGRLKDSFDWLFEPLLEMLGANVPRGDKKMTVHFRWFAEGGPVRPGKIARGEIRTLDQALKRRVLYR